MEPDSAPVFAQALEQFIVDHNLPFRFRVLRKSLGKCILEVGSEVRQSKLIAAAELVIK
jgi:hypothetical protein